MEALKILDDFLDNLQNKNKQKQRILFIDVCVKFLQSKIRQGLSPKTIGKYQDYIKLLKGYYGQMNLNDITKLTLKQYEDYRTINGDRPEYIREQLQTLSIIFNFANEFDLIKENPFISYKFKKHLPRYMPRIKFLNPQECQKLISYCNDNLKRLVIFLLETGCRIGETLQLMTTDLCVDYKTRLPYITIRKDISKTKKQRIIPLSKLAMEQVNKQILNNNIFIFTTTTGRQYKQAPRKALTKALIKADLKERFDLFHLLRHTAGSLWLQGLNIDGTKRKPMRIELVSEILGHSDIKITKNIYAQFDKQDIITAFIN
jgi:integrase